MTIINWIKNKCNNKYKGLLHQMINYKIATIIHQKWEWKFNFKKKGAICNKIRNIWCYAVTISISPYPIPCAPTLTYIILIHSYKHADLSLHNSTCGKTYLHQMTKNTCTKCQHDGSQTGPMPVYINEQRIIVIVCVKASNSQLYMVNTLNVWTRISTIIHSVVQCTHVVKDRWWI